MVHAGRMGFEPVNWDILVPGVYGGPVGPQGPLKKVDTTSIAAKLIAAAFGTEVIFYDTTMILEPQLGLMDFATWNVATSGAFRLGCKRQQPSYIKRLFLSIVADQDVSIYQRHLAANDSAWRAFGDNNSPSVSPTVVTANTPTLLTLPFFGDDHQCSIKANSAAPTFVAISLRLTADQALAE